MALLLLAPVSGCHSLCVSDVFGPSPDAVRSEQAAIVARAPELDDVEDVGLQDLLDWHALPSLRADEYRQFSSHKREGQSFLLEPGGKDFNNFLTVSGFRSRPWLAAVDHPDQDGGGLGGYVLAASDDGPGYVSRMFFTRFCLLDAVTGIDFRPFRGEVLKVYVDDLDGPSFVIPLADLGNTEPFGPALAGTTSSAVLSYTPISFARRLRIVLDGLCPSSGYFYEVAVKHTPRTTRPFSPRLAEDPRHEQAANRLQQIRPAGGDDDAPPSEKQRIEVPPGQVAIVLAEDVGGMIERLWLRFDDAAPEQLRDVRLRVTFDDSGAPSIDLPLDAFLGCREGAASFRTLPLEVRWDGSRVSADFRLPMPFARHARVELRNERDHSVVVHVAGSVRRGLPVEPWGYLHARTFTAVGPQPPNSQFEVINVQGRGRFLGTFLFAAGRSDRREVIRNPLNILEGNATGIIDGRVAIRGTGTEDYYNGGFYFSGGAFDHPFAATNVVRDRTAGGIGVASCCRWHVLSDAIDFERSFVLRFQYANDHPDVVVRYSTMAYYYLDRPEPGAVSGGNVIAEPDRRD